MSNITSAGVKYGMPATPVQPFGPGAAPAAITNGAVTTIGLRSKGRGVTDPSNPEFWLLGVGLVTLGFLAVSTSAKVGPFRFSASAGS